MRHEINSSLSATASDDHDLRRQNRRFASETRPPWTPVRQNSLPIRAGAPPYRKHCPEPLPVNTQLLTHAYEYDSNPALFLKKFRKEVSIGHLESYDVIYTYGEQRPIASLKQSGQSLKNRDLLLCILHEKGFTPQELSVVFGMKNCNSIYVRYSRIRKQHELLNNNTQTDENRKNSCR